MKTERVAASPRNGTFADFVENGEHEEKLSFSCTFPPLHFVQWKPGRVQWKPAEVRLGPLQLSKTTQEKRLLYIKEQQQSQTQNTKTVEVQAQPVLDLLAIVGCLR